MPNPSTELPSPVAPDFLRFIVPVFNRPEELAELLTSLAGQSDKRFAITVVEDGSTRPSKEVVDSFSHQMKVLYLSKSNSGPGPSRNYGCLHSDGDFFVFVDSDCVLPSQYVETVLTALAAHPAHAYGGPDAAHESFSPLQKAINHVMTSFLTTGGIRGGSERVAKFMPRSFNMGFSRAVFQQTGGFPEVRFAPAKAAGEDLDLSYSILEAGFQVIRIPEAFVWHKRRTNWSQFRRQVFNFGYARITVSKRHPGTLRWVHGAPSVYVLSLISCLCLALAHSPVWLVGHALHALAIAVSGGIRERSIAVGFLSLLAGIVQLVGYGTGFLRAVLAPLDLNSRP
jgi:GT2 family glycosyltransferase